MKVHRQEIPLSSQGHQPSFFKITKYVQKIIDMSGIKEGMCLVYSHHTTCSVITEEDSFDTTNTGLEYLQQDLVDVMEKFIPTCRKEGQYMHPGPEATVFAEAHGESKQESLNTDAHLRSSIIGRSVSLAIINGKLDLGEFGHIYFIDFNQTRPRNRVAQVQVIGE